VRLVKKKKRAKKVKGTIEMLGDPQNLMDGD
jgi:hypothetical protein